MMLLAHVGHCDLFQLFNLTLLDGRYQVRMGYRI